MLTWISETRNYLRRRQALLVAHISDTHITTGPRSSSPAEHLYRALDRIQALSPHPDFILITGDLVDQGRPEEYKEASAILRHQDIPVHIVPGNHDNASRLLAAFQDTSLAQAAPAEPTRCYYRIDYPGLRLLCCDSSVPGRHDGELGAAQLAWIDAELKRNPDTPTILAMHHHPVPSGIEAMDKFMLSDADQLADVLHNHEPLARILIGHLHRPMTAVFAGALVASAPSTYRQVHLDLNSRERGAYVDEPPALLLHQFRADTTVTHLVPIWHSGPPMGII